MEKTIQKGKKLNGEVVGNSMMKTVKVQISDTFTHPKYLKIVKWNKTYMAHTETPIEVGAKVEITESKAYSKNVKWVVTKINGTKTN